ncbi:hypothetical protein C5167_017552, partial [Papaver somniferum]
NDDASDDGAEVNDQGKEGEEDPQYYKDFQDDNPEFEDEPSELFDESDFVKPLDPSEMIVGITFPDKDAFKRHLKLFCVKNECEFKARKSDKKRLRVWCENRFDHRGKVESEWFVFASILPKQSTFKVRSVNLTHTCKGRIVEDKIPNRSADPPLIVEVIPEQLKNGSG